MVSQFWQRNWRLWTSLNGRDKGFEFRRDALCPGEGASAAQRLFPSRISSRRRNLPTSPRCRRQKLHSLLGNKICRHSPELMVPCEPSAKRSEHTTLSIAVFACIGQAAGFQLPTGRRPRESRGNLRVAELSENATSALQRIVQPVSVGRKPAFTHSGARGLACLLHKIFSCASPAGRSGD